MSRIPGWTKVSSLALRLVLFAGVAHCAQLAGPAWAGVIYVRADAAGTKTGHSWADAYTDLQTALAAAVWYDEIWVAKGTYKPTTGTLRTVSFVLKTRVGLYGGFAGTETGRDQRNWTANPTILSGDIGTTDTADNSNRVVVGADLTVLDGFTITGGNATGSSLAMRNGGGMCNLNCSPTVINCTFSGNAAASGGNEDGRGGGMYNSGGSPTVTNCTFSDNTASNYNGGGMCNEGGSPTVTNCTFSGNKATAGGGMNNYSGSSPTVTNCTFSGNAAAYGGGVYGGGTFTNCTFSGNTAGSGSLSSGGGMYNSGSPAVTNCTFSGNTAPYGGGMFNNSGSPTVTNCAFSGNTATTDTLGYGGNGGGMYNDHSLPTVTNCTFSSNAAKNGGGMYNSGSGSPIVTNCTFSGNAAASDTWGNGGNGGGMCNESSSPTVANCIFWDNTAPSGAEIYTGSETPTFRHCDIRGSGGSGALWDPALGADGGGNIMSDPRFVAPGTPAGPDGHWRTGDDGLRLQSNSPCIGTADPAVAPGTDILGLPRKAAPDIGAYEFWPLASADPAWQLFK